MDIFGDALRDWQAGDHDHMLSIRRDDDFVDTHAAGLYFEGDPFPDEIKLLAQIKAPVLDVGCGAGRSLLWLKKQGLKATGIDLSPGAVEVARQRGCPDVRFGDILDHETEMFGEDRFETIILFGNNMGIGGTRKGAEKLLRRLHGITEPGGKLCVTGLNIAVTDDPRHLAYHRANLAKGKNRGEIKMRFEYKGNIGDWLAWYHPEPEELGQLARDTGWGIAAFSATDGPFYWAVLRKAHNRAP